MLNRMKSVCFQIKDIICFNSHYILIYLHLDSIKVNVLVSFRMLSPGCPTFCYVFKYSFHSTVSHKLVEQSLGLGGNNAKC
jgi:hypothetical protein